MNGKTATSMLHACLFCHLVWMVSLIPRNNAEPQLDSVQLEQLEETAYRYQMMNACPKQKTTEQLIYSVEVSSVNQCAAACVNEKSCKSANLCSTGGSKVCTLSGKYPWKGCNGNSANDDCKYLFPEMPCLNGGTAVIYRYYQFCRCPKLYAGDFCERLYYDCDEFGCVKTGSTWIQRGRHPPFAVNCYYRYTYFMKVDVSLLPTKNFPLNKTFDEYKTRFANWGYLNGGLESIHIATSQAYYMLKTDVRTLSAMLVTYYHNFTLASANERYRLDYLSVTGGPDGLAAMKGRPFSAVGNDPEGCAQMHNVAWWYTANCTAPLFMIYNDKGRISFPENSDTTTILDYDEAYMFLEFKGFK